jgi:glycerol-3-phosphate dehydrogenase subunit B
VTAARVLIVGAGIAGAMAALGARTRGAAVTVLWRAPGATALYAGGMEITEPLAGLAGRDPCHPFLRLGLSQPELERTLDECTEVLRAHLAGAGLELLGDWWRGEEYLDLHGRPRPAQLVPATVAPGALSALRGRRLAVVGFPPVAEYDAASTAEAISQLEGVRAEPLPVEIELPLDASLTDLFGRPAPLVDTDADLIAYPPGLEDLPPRGFELLAAVPSPHGLRLQRALERMLLAAGVEMRRGTAEAIEAGAGGVRSVAGIEADQFILAAGRYLGGGLVKEGAITEPLFGLGVFHEGRRYDHERSVRLHHLEELSPEPAFRAGLMTDPDLRPLDAEGAPAHANLRAAGSVLGGYDYGSGFGFGVPMLTGWLAGCRAATA